jgi:hypothetical protein
VKIDARGLVGPLVAALVLILTVQQTLGSLHRAGLWAGNARFGTVRADEPYARLDQSIAQAHAAASGDGMRDPFSFGNVTQVTVRRREIPVVKPPRVIPPVLTAIVWDADPRALIRLNGHEYTVRSGGEFEQYRVLSITRDQVTLDHDGQSLVLNRPLKGD